MFSFARFAANFDASSMQRWSSFAFQLAA